MNMSMMLNSPSPRDGACLRVLDPMAAAAAASATTFPTAATPLTLRSPARSQAQAQVLGQKPSQSNHFVDEK
jgi:hypothetical protein